MKKILIVLAIAAIDSCCLLAQVLAWDPAGLAGNEFTFNATTQNANLEISTLSRGAGINASSLANAFSSTNFTLNGTVDSALLYSDYFEFAIRAVTAYKFSLTTLDANFRRSNTGPRYFQWQYSLDGFATSGVNIGSQITYTGTETNGLAQTQIDLSGIAALQNVRSNTTVTIRLYGYGATLTVGTFAIGRLTGNDLAIGGSVVPSEPQITFTLPESGKVDVLVNTKIKIGFTKPINSSFFAYTCNPDPGGWSNSWNAANDTVTITHANFSYLTGHTFQVTQARDMSGNDLVAGNIPNPFTFTTVNSNPVVTGTSPLQGEVNVAVSAPVRIGFSEPINSGSFTYTCNPDPGGWSPSWNGAGDTVTLNHNVFTNSVQYSFQVTQARDLAGNPLAAGGTPNPFIFTVIPSNTDTLKIICLDIGQGNATFIRSPSGQRALIDGGRNSDSLEIMNFIRDSLDTPHTLTLDYLFLTHYDADHSGVSDNVVNSLAALNIGSYDRGDSHASGDTDHDRYVAAMTAKFPGKRDSLRVGAKQTFDLGSGVTIQAVCVNGSTISGDSYTPSATDENNHSAGLVIRYGAFSMLVAGDLESQVENVLAGDFDSVSVLHVNHHGSSTSSIQKWVDSLNPQVSVISVGDGNSYGHPTQDALNRLCNDPGGNNYIYQTETGSGGTIPSGRGRVCNRNIHISVMAGGYIVDGDMRALAVQLGLFTYSADATGITLSWRTESETNCYQWRIERSADRAGVYTVIGHVPGHGTTSRPQQYSYLDNTLSATGVYWYRLVEIDLSGNQTSHGPIRAVYNRLGIAAFQAGPACPNPSSGVSSISYQLPLPGKIELGVYNVLGQLVRTLAGGRQEAGRYTVPWNGRGANGRVAANGVYFYRLQYQDDSGTVPLQSAVSKLVLIR